jgi:predicted nucleic acid-binding protein
MIIPDASIIGKLFLAEEDSPAAEALIRYAITNDIALVAPAALLYEALSIALRHTVPFAAVLELLNRLRTSGLTLCEPTVGELMIAEKITTTGHKKTGYPALNDSIYHAMAIERAGTLVTADQRHVAKTKQFGSVTLLADWQPR